MERYRNSGRDSGVDSFEIGDDYIEVKFTGTFKKYRYSYMRAGRHHVDQMKVLARRGSGLNSYINSNVKFKFDR
jgi:hypothetical protein